MERRRLGGWYAGLRPAHCCENAISCDHGLVGANLAATRLGEKTRLAAAALPAYISMMRGAPLKEVGARASQSCFPSH